MARQFVQQYTDRKENVDVYVSRTELTMNCSSSIAPKVSLQGVRQASSAPLCALCNESACTLRYSLRQILMYNYKRVSLVLGAFESLN